MGFVEVLLSLSPHKHVSSSSGVGELLLDGNVLDENAEIIYIFFFFFDFWGTSRFI